jgi:enoyl-CoA hydratase/carnithine racemase
LVRAGGEGIFSAGFDLTALGGAPSLTLPDERLSQVLSLLEAHPAPSVALVNGPAIGAGCELAVACDFRVGGPQAMFCMPPAKVGVVYSLAGIERLVARAGEAFARSMFLTGRRVSASEAARVGLLTELADDAEGAAFALCDELAANAPLAVAGLKRGLALVRAKVVSDEARASYEALRRASFESDDAKEGVSAALAKRAPRFSGR